VQLLLLFDVVIRYYTGHIFKFTLGINSKSIVWKSKERYIVTFDVFMIL
jgi:hypothetical protein